MARILVTGCKGFIGRNLVKALTERGQDEIVGFSRTCGESKLGNSVWKCDITDARLVSMLVNYFKPQVIFHLAGNAIVKENAASPSRLTEVNVVGTHNLLASSPKGCKFILASSATVYGNTFGDLAHEHELTKPTSTYGAAKVGAEALVNAFTELGRVEGINLRLTANVGPYSTHGLLHDVIRKLKSDSEQLELLGDAPGSTKPYTHVSDTVNAMLLAEKQWGVGTYNISTTIPISVDVVASIAMEETGIQKEIKWLGEVANWKGDNRIVCVNNRLARCNGFKPQLESFDAIRKAVRDIMKEQNA